MTHQECKGLMILELVEARELVRKGDDFYEDLGGHIIHESNLDSYIEDYVSRLSEDERNELATRIGVPE